MKRNPEINVWQIGPYELKMIVDAAGVGQLNHQTPDSRLLRSLAVSEIKGVAACALDVVFQWGYNCRDIYDALAAYSCCPLQNPPAKYVEMFKTVDWTSDSPSNALYSIILAGSSQESDKKLLLKLLADLSSDFRDASIFAASSFSDWRFVEAIANIGLNTKEREAFSTGEMHAVIFCFKRWLDRGTLTMKQLQELLILESEKSHRIRWKRLMNYIMCPEWRCLPFPEEQVLPMDID